MRKGVGCQVWGVGGRAVWRVGSAALCALAALTSPSTASYGQTSARHPTPDTRHPSTRLLDAFDNVVAWTAQPSDGVSLAIHADPAGRTGRAMRLDVDFHGGAGYAIARRALPVELPDDYEFSFWVRGDVPPNNLEFKLVDSTGDNVWWVNTRDFAFGRAWRKVTIKKRHVSFAWGPAGGGVLRRVAALEIVVTAGSGGRGSVWVDDLALAERPPQPAAWPAPAVRASSAPGEAARAVDGDSTTAWRSAGTGPQALTLDFGARRELGGLTLLWAPRAHAVDYDVDTTGDGRSWGTAYRVRGGNGGRDPIPLPETDARAVRLRLRRPAAGAARYALREVVVEPLAWTATPNDFAAALARAAPRGSYPRYLSGEQSYWTITGAQGDAAELLLNEEGMVETGKGQFSLEPFLYEGGRLVTWADARHTPSLAEGDLPIPSVRWEPAAGSDSALALTVTAYADGEPGRSVGYARYRVENRGAAPRRATLFVTLRPFQVNPPWQFLNTPGGVAPIREVGSRARSGGRVVTVDGTRRVVALTPGSAFGAATFDEGNVVDFLRAGRVPPHASAADGGGRASAALAWALELPPHASRDLYVAVPLHAASPLPASDSAAAAALARATATWRDALSRVRITLPDTFMGVELAATMRTALAHVLVNRDGPAIQPGSRSYERSWIRDGALTSAALLRLGHEEEVRQFIEWYAPYQYPNGKVPCCVDRRGADPVPEHDSHGELIYLIAEYWRYTGDTALVRRMWPHVAKAAGYIDTLRRERTTAEYASGAKRVFYGILPPSISHEGYSAKPMHSYWDDWFAVRGLEDAAALAAVLGRADERARFAALADSLRASVLASYRLTMAQHGIDFLPGSADLGDFDATSTTTAIAPGGELARLPQPALRNTFDRYWAQQFAPRYESTTEEAYTPYEWRVVGTLLRLGEKERAQVLAGLLLKDRRPEAWHQWAEVVWRDPLAPKFIGDMPHGWVASDFLRSALDFLAYDREEDGALVVGAGVDGSWVRTAPGVRVTGLRTYEGTLDLAMTGDARAVRVSIGGSLRVPRGGVVVRSPFNAPVRSAMVNGERVEVVGGREVVVRKVPAEVVMRY